MANIFQYRSPFGPVTIASDDEHITMIRLSSLEDDLHASFDLTGFETKPNRMLNACANELLEYFSGKRASFTVPIDPRGTVFQLKVWEALQDIPYGQTRTATEIAEVIGHPKSYKAVGSAVYSNPIAIIIPSHRVSSTSLAQRDMRTAKMQEAFRKLEKRFA